MNPRYFAGSASNLGDVSALAATSFEELVALLSQPVVLPLSRAAFHLLPAKERQRVKRVKYIVPAAFGSSPSPRKTENAVRCNLLALDIDNEAEAADLLARGIGQKTFEDLGRLGYIVWHTASSTPAKPRLRVIVNAEGIPVSSYARAVGTVAEMLGLGAVTKESLVPVQPMFWPTMFDGDNLIEDWSPIVN